MGDIKAKKTQKELTSQLAAVDGELEAMKTEIANKQREFERKKEIAASLKVKIKKCSTPHKPRVSEHALVRYFERVKGFNMEEVTQEILSEPVLNLVEKLGGSGTYPNKGFSVVMKDNMVVTIK